MRYQAESYFFCKNKTLYHRLRLDSDAGAVRRVPVHGYRLTGRSPVLRQDLPLLHAQEVPAGLSVSQRGERHQLYRVKQ